MNKTTINGVDCYGTAKPDANYQMTFEDEYFDGIACDIVCSGWKSVIAHLKKNGWLDRGLVEVVAC